MFEWPTKENPDQYYKVASAYITLSMDQNVTERQTYSFLEWLGDVGGLYDALRLIGLLTITPFGTFARKAMLLSEIFRFTESKRFADKRAKKGDLATSQQSRSSVVSIKDEKELKRKELQENMQWDFAHAAYIPRESFFRAYLGKPRVERYTKMLNKADTAIIKELDLIKFLQRQRLTTFNLLATMNARQSFIADKMATMIIRESSDLDGSTEEDFELEQEN